MPWKPEDATRHTKKANTPEKRAKWARISTAILEKTGDEGKAVRIANSKMSKGGAVEQDFLPTKDTRYSTRGNTFGQGTATARRAPKMRYAQGGSVGKKKWIQGVKLKKGALHEQMGVPKGQKIPRSRVIAASHSGNPKLRHRAQMARNMGGYSAGGHVGRADGIAKRGHTRGRTV